MHIISVSVHYISQYYLCAWTMGKIQTADVGARNENGEGENY